MALQLNNDFLEWLSSIADNTFYEFAIILSFAALLAMFGQLLKQPLIVMFIFLGIILGPAVLDIVKSKDNIHLLAEIGIAILLFIVGLKLDLRIIRSVGRIALLTGLGQVIFTSLFGYFIGIGLGFSSLHSFYIAVALTFSSTIIIVKLLSDKREIDSLHGQIAIGFLIVQDIVVILVMITLSAIGRDTGEPLINDLFKTFLVGFVLLGVSLAVMKWVIPKLTHFLAKSQEMLTLFAIAWAVFLATAGELMGFSGEVGAFLAGISLASSEFKETISNRLVSLRDFLLLFFFVHLGSELDFSVIGSQLNAAIVFSLFVLIGNPIIVLIIMGRMGYRKRTAFLAGLTVAQISEFSLIFAGLGLTVGHITDETVGLITLVGLITIGLSTYLILYSHPIYEKIAPLLSVFERKNPFQEDKNDAMKLLDYDIIIIGLGRFGNRISSSLESHKELRVVGVDYDPEKIKQWKTEQKSVIYGDAEDPDLIDLLPYKEAKYIITAIPEFEHSQKLVQNLRKKGYTGKVVLTSINNENLEDCGADIILKPFEMAADNFYDNYLAKFFN